MLAAAYANGAHAADDSSPIRLGFLTIHSGALAAGGRQMEEGLRVFLQERHNAIAGRQVKLFVADTAGQPAVTKSKTQELVEKDGVQVIIGPLAAFEALAINDYIEKKQIPIISPSAAAEDLTQRKRNPWFVRAVGSSAQPMQPLGDYAAKDLHYKKVATIADDFAYGYESIAGFQRTFEQNGGEVVQKLWAPLNVADYGTYISEIDPKVDAVLIGFAGSNSVRFLKQYAAYGMKGKIPVIAGMIATDEGILKKMGNEAVGIISAGWYAATIDNPANKRFVKEMNAEYKEDPGYYSVGAYGACLMLEQALKSVHGNIEDKNAFMNALRHVHVADDPRGDIKLDSYGNPIMNVYIRKVERQNGKLVNAIIKTYPAVSQFWTYDPAKFLAHPVYSRDYPPAKFLEK
ncbi:MAG: ABC transporter substrate-binding protein [Candidimonas sp.]|nr:MAG: ABC transporter substrate-binding protein [Candidimonas sp.]